MTLSFSLERTPSGHFSKGLVRIKCIQHIQLDLREKSAHKLETKIAYLNQTYILHLIALWQVFIERLAEFALKKITTDQKNNILIAITEANLQRALARFNTPNRQNIDRLFLETLEIPQITECWRSDKITYEEALATLENLLGARHEIAHTASTGKALTFEKNFLEMEKLFHMAELLELEVFKRISGKEP